MLSDKQEQTVGDGGFAIQAKGNITFQGPSPEHIDQMVKIFMVNNFPRLREEAQQAAEEHVNKLGETLKATLAASIEKIKVEKLADPDVQATINDAVQASARRGEKANPELLCSLIAERISSNENEFNDIVISEAVRVVGHLTKEQISFLSLITFVKTMSFNLSTLRQLEIAMQKAFMACGAGFRIKSSQTMHLIYTGAAFHRALGGGDIYRETMTRYPHLGYSDVEKFKQELDENAPTWKILLNAYEELRGFQFHLTGVGRAIGIANLSRQFGPLGYNLD